jgi:hypothetical protein
MPNSYTTQSGVTLSRDAFICHYVAAFMAKHPSIEVAVAFFEAARAWDRIEQVQP